MVEFLRPSSDVSAGGWTPSAGTTLWETLDESTQADADYVKSSVNPSNDVFEVALSDPSAALLDGTIKFAIGKETNNAVVVDVTVALMQGTTVIASWSYPDVAFGLSLKTQTLTAPQIAAITSGGGWNDLRLRVTANVPVTVAALSLDFTTGTLDSKVTLTRSTTATYYNSSGVLSTAAINAARFDHDPVTLAARGLLIEEQRTNLCLEANTGIPAPWTPFYNGTGIIGFAGNGTAPDGSASASRIFVDRSSTADYAEYYQVLSGTTNASHTASVWFKAYAAGDIGKQITLTLNNGTSLFNPTLVTLTASWVRYTSTGTTTGSGDAIVFGYIVGSGTQTGPVDFWYWGAQVELGDFATSFIPTTTAAVTRAADVAVMTGTNFSSWYNASAGTFIAQFDGLASGTRPIIAADDNTANEVIMLYGSGTDPKAIVTDGGATQADLDAGTIAAGTAYKLGLSFAANDFAACLNGGTVATDTSGTLPTPTQLRIGLGPAGNYLNGHVTRLDFYNVAKTDAELQALTA